MRDINQLLEKLLEAGIPLETVRKKGGEYEIVYKEATSEEQKDAGEQLRRAFVPVEDKEDHLRERLRDKGISDHDLLMALWERVVRGAPGACEALNGLLDALSAELEGEA